MELYKLACLALPQLSHQHNSVPIEYTRQRSLGERSTNEHHFSRNAKKLNVFRIQIFSELLYHMYGSVQYKRYEDAVVVDFDCDQKQCICFENEQIIQFNKGSANIYQDQKRLQSSATKKRRPRPSLFFSSKTSLESQLNIIYSNTWGYEHVYINSDDPSIR